MNIKNVLGTRLWIMYILSLSLFCLFWVAVFMVAIILLNPY